MTRSLVLTLTLCALLPAGAALAQAPDFGTDSSPWANDGECDDMRFQGPGMTTTVLLESDVRADATDCRNAFNAGQITLLDGAAAAVPGKGGGDAPAPQAVGGINFGDDTSEWARDGECDDRRFTGSAMATALGWENSGRDATDCRSLVDAGRVRLWVMADALAATQCGSLNFGDDSSEFAMDGECDDMRFEGPGMAGIVNTDNTLRDATDCRQYCAYGVIALRDY
jgi:hypothetical protein